MITGKSPFSILTSSCAVQRLFLAHKRLRTSYRQRCTGSDFQTDVINTTATKRVLTLKGFETRHPHKAAQTIHHFPGELETNLHSGRG